MFWTAQFWFFLFFLFLKMLSRPLPYVVLVLKCIWYFAVWLWIVHQELLCKHSIFLYLPADTYMWMLMQSNAHLGRFGNSLIHLASLRLFFLFFSVTYMQSLFWMTVECNLRILVFLSGAAVPSHQFLHTWMGFLHQIITTKHQRWLFLLDIMLSLHSWLALTRVQSNTGCMAAQLPLPTIGAFELLLPD